MSNYLPVINYNKIKYNNHKILPNVYRMCILGKTGLGKSTLLFRMILDKIIDYEEIYILFLQQYFNQNINL